MNALGRCVQRIESDVMAATLLALMGRRIVALPIFDGVLVAESRAEKARGIMERAFERIVGVDAEVPVTLSG